MRVQAMVQAWFTQINAQHRDPRDRDQDQDRSDREAHNRAVRLQVGPQCSLPCPGRSAGCGPCR